MLTCPVKPCGASRVRETQLDFLRAKSIKTGFQRLCANALQDVLEGLATITDSSCVPLAQEAHQYLRARGASVTTPREE